MGSLSEEKKFIVDAMLGDVARWLRLMGYDTLYAGNKRDNEIIAIAEKEGRVIVTRDRGLYWRAKKRGLEAVILDSRSEVAEKIAMLARRTGIRVPEEIDPSVSRCPVCNGVLVEVSRDEVRGAVPEKVLNSYDKFWRCSSCGKIYWRGSHWKGITLTLKEARRMLGKA